MLADLDHFGKNYKEEEERQSRQKPWMLTWPQVKLVALAGVGFFLDAYDLYVVLLTTLDVIIFLSFIFIYSALSSIVRIVSICPTQVAITDFRIFTEVTPLLAVVYFPTNGLPNQMQDLVKAGANIGPSIFGRVFSLYQVFKKKQVASLVNFFSVSLVINSVVRSSMERNSSLSSSPPSSRSRSRPISAVIKSSYGSLSAVSSSVSVSVVIIL